MEELTKAEERIMLVYWKIKKGFVKDVINQLSDGEKTPYNTISSVVRILVSKGYLDFKAYGKTYEYFPKISKSDYRKIHFKKMISGYFGDSPASLLSYMVKEEELSQEEINKLKEIINKIE
jgi:BlaI family transcriptional regulator, penicillinase repressor